jgi:hypothetical protein
VPAGDEEWEYLRMIPAAEMMAVPILGWAEKLARTQSRTDSSPIIKVAALMTATATECEVIFLLRSQARDPLMV